MFLNPYKYSFLFIITLYSYSLFAQNWSWIGIYGDQNNETIDAILTKDSASNYIAGTFDNEFNLANYQFSTSGNNDVYIAKISQDDNVIWAISAGSTQDDAIIDMEMDIYGNIYVLGSYWFEITFGNNVLESGPSSKAYFLVKLSPSGTIIWTKNFTGDQDKQLASIAVDPLNDEIYLIGDFNGNFFLDDLQVANGGNKSVLIAKLNTDGTSLWLNAFSCNTFIEGKDIATYNGKILLSGHFRGSVDFGQIQLSTLSFDNDIFVGLLEADGSVIWARRAGGVYEQNNNACTFDESGNIYATGHFIGVIKMNDDIQIQTNGLNNNFYLLKYTIDGEPLWGRSYGSIAEEYAEDIVCKGQSVYVCGSFNGTMEIDGINLQADEVYSDGFILRFDETGVARKATTLYSAGYCFPYCISIDEEENIWASGIFEEQLTIDGAPYSSNGNYDGFLAQMSQDFTPVKDIEDINSFFLFPNPVKDILRIESPWSTYTISIYDSKGQVKYIGEKSVQIDLGFLEPGIFIIQIKNKKGLTKSQTLFKL